jgi:transcriptional regulator with XRE-family HTH domain
MTHDEKTFFRDLGARIAQLRRDQNLTQQALADELGLSACGPGPRTRSGRASLVYSLKSWVNSKPARCVA